MPSLWHCTPPTALSLVLPLPLASPRYMQNAPYGATPMRGKIASVRVEIPLADWNAHGSTALP